MKRIVNNFEPMGGKHCITNSLKQIFTYYGYPISEAMLFGIASGLSFIYINQSASPMVSGRTKVFEFENKIAKRLNIEIKCKSHKDYTKIMQVTKNMIDTNNPVLIYVDMPYMKYLHMDPHSHFGGHAVVLFGYSNEERKFWISDRDNHDYPIRIPTGDIAMDYHIVSYEELEKARSSSYRPFPAHNKYLTFDFNNFRDINKIILKESIVEVCDSMLNPPAQLLGINGIKKFSKEILKWKDFDSKKLTLACVTNYFQISADGGTGGGIFRKLYGEFLIESASIINDDRLIDLGNQFINISQDWDKIAADLWKLSQSLNVELLKEISASILDMYNNEKELYSLLKNTID